MPPPTPVWSSSQSTPTPDRSSDVAVLDRPEPDLPWVTLVWNDPVNLMSYVTWVLQTHFGYQRSKAEALMMDVHHKGRAVVSTGSKEKVEADTEAMHGYGLWATFQKDE
ncbi:MAG: ATP-dependent Clp protease adapter ClpS [Ornithinimicrobium sp.]